MQLLETHIRATDSADMGSGLTETEIFECLRTNFRLAAELADDLARLPAKGPAYSKFRETLKILETACRQAGHWREDARWFNVGLYIEECHKRAGKWLRMRLRQGDLHPLFRKLAENLRAGAKSADTLQHGKTGRTGAILPAPRTPDHRDTRPAGWNSSPSGLLVPAGT